MPTYGRPQFVSESIAMFILQDYPNKELIVLNDCPGQRYESNSPNVRIINETERYPTLGEKRNAAIAMAQGSIIAVWDDDDVYLPWRLSYSIERMCLNNLEFYLPHEFWAYWGDSALHDNQVVPGWISHPMAMFSRRLFTAVGGYPKQTLGEDAVLFAKIFTYLGAPEKIPTDPIAPVDRLMIYRGKSQYQHTSIKGGIGPADTSPGTFDLEPQSISDPVLRMATQRLTYRRQWSEGLTKNSFATRSELSRFEGVHLDDLPLSVARTGYGELGTHGSLGYENKIVQVGGRLFRHSLSAHASSAIDFELDGHYTHFTAWVALNDDVAGYSTSANFRVVFDGQLALTVYDVRPNCLPRKIDLPLQNARNVSLITEAIRWDFCHTVWLEPRLEKWECHQNISTDCLQRAHISTGTTHRAEEIDLCIATVGSPGLETWIDDLFGSIRANGNCPDAKFALFFFGESDLAVRIAKAYDAIFIPCQPKYPLSHAAKSVLYSASRFIPAQRFICIDADMLVLGDLKQLAGAIECHSPSSILVCREAHRLKNLGEALSTIYGGQKGDEHRLLCGFGQREAEYPFVVNDGLFAASADALRGLDQLIRSMSEATEWVNQGPSWRNQFIFNLAIAHLDVGIPIDPLYNVQLKHQNIEVLCAAAPLHAKIHGSDVRVLHFNSNGRHRFPEMRGKYRRLG